MSRSGTTLLTTILDAHPDVSMGYELLPAGIADAGAAATRIEQVIPEDGNPRDTSRRLEDQGEKDLGVLVHRADRSLVTPPDLVEILRDFAGQGRNDLTDFEGRIAISRAIVERKSRAEGTAISGFKLNSPRVGVFDKHIGGDAAYVYIVRDPRDVWRSHVERGFDRTVEQVANAWTDYLRRFENFARNNPGRAHLIRYEDLVAAPKESLDALCATIGLTRDPAMDRFYESKASVLRGGHANSDKLQQDFFTSSVGQWSDKVTEDDLRLLESVCFEGMDAHGYRRETSVGFRFRQQEWQRNLERLAKKRKYNLAEYAGLVLPAVERYPHRTWVEATDPQATPTKNGELLLIRHDIDHDIENAVTLAKWEAEQGIRTTYCVLHTAWYYGRQVDGRLAAHSEQMVEKCLEIQDLGHEINLHNNTIVVALRTGRDPYDVLEEELCFLRSRGLDVRGTSTHGDALCGQLDVQNFELFSETVYPSRGGARTIEHEGHRVTIGTRSMKEFGLTYEGYDLPRDIYISDSGGNLRVEPDRPGRAGVSRAEMETPPPYSKIVGILTHPVWWALTAESGSPRKGLGFDDFLAQIGELPRRGRLLGFLRR